MKFIHVDYELKTKAELIESNGRHFYKCPSGEIYPSITTKLSKTKDYSGINWWKSKVGHDVADYIMKTAMTSGTATHSMIENYLNNVPSDIVDLMPNAHLNNIKPLLNNINNIYFLEVPLYSDKLQTAGTCDCIAEYNGVLSIIDFKTSRKKKKDEYITDYFLQGTAYSIMFEEMTGIKIEQVVILISGEDGSVGEYIVNTVDHTESLNEKLSLYTSI